mgnify:CR=1 FL=1
MDWATVLIVMLGALCGLLMLGLPVAFAFIAINIGGAFFILGGENGLVQMTRNAAGSLTNFQLAPIPLFILMGEILFHSGVAYRAIDAIERVITRLPGRMALVSVAGGTVFSALSGSTIANTAMLGSTLLPDMLKRGYHPSMAMGPIMASGAIAMLIPPSALAVLLGSLAGISIAQLLVAGILPALILAALFSVYILARCVANPALAPVEAETRRLGLVERWTPFVRYVLPLSGIFLVVIGGLLAGLATPTESAALGCVAAVLAALVYRSLTWEGMRKALMETVKISVMILFIIVASQTFSQILSFSGATNGLIRTIEALALEPTAILIGMIMILLFLGCFIDQVSMMMVTIPIFIPLASAVGIDPLVLGVVYLLTMEIGLLTPPFGLLLFVMKGVAPPEIRMQQVYLAITPFVIIKLAVLALIVLLPQIGTILPEAMR